MFMILIRWEHSFENDPGKKGVKTCAGFIYLMIGFSDIHR